MAAEREVKGSNPILDAFGINGLREEGFYGFLTQLTFPLIHKIDKGVREGIEQPNAITYPDRALGLGDVMVILSTLVVAITAVPVAVGLKVGYNLVVNTVYEGLRMDQKIAVRKPKERKVLKLS